MPPSCAPVCVSVGVHACVCVFDQVCCYCHNNIVSMVACVHELYAALCPLHLFLAFIPDGAPN